MDDRRHSERHRSADHRRGEFEGTFYDAAPGHANISLAPGFTIFGDEVLFRGVDTAGAAGLWMTDGTATGTSEIVGINGAPSTAINPTDITVYNGMALFNGVNAAGRPGLWTTDGTSGGTHELASSAARRPPDSTPPT